jgi:RNase P subunit RPR2
MTNQQETDRKYKNYICKNCNSELIGWDAYVDQNGNVLGGPYDHCECMDCGSTDIRVE